MKDRSRKYGVEPILRLAESLKNDEASYEWLKKNDYKELAALSDVILLSSDSAKNWLLDHNFKILSAFISAIANSDSAFDYLLSSDYKEWAAVFSSLYNDEEAVNWLVKHKLKHYGYLARIIYTIKNSNMEHSYFTTMSVSGGSGLSGGGTSGSSFSGGGGSFGGAGASGSW